MILAHCSSGFKHSLNEIMGDQTVMATVQSMACSGETAMLEKFFEMLAVCEDKVTYGPKSVEKALENNAVETLLLSDKLFRAKNVEQRKYYVKIYDRATHLGLNVVLFGATNSAAQRLNGLTGIAAILRYEMAELQDIIESDEDSDDSSDLENEHKAPSEEDG